MNRLKLSAGEDREKDHLQNFRKIVRDLLLLLRTSLQVETVSMHWVNNNRKIFVLASYATICKNVRFQDRVKRELHLLGKFSTIKSITRLEKNVHFKSGDLTHYSSSPPINHIYLIPFVVNAETVAITTVEASEKPEWTAVDEQTASACQKVLGRMLKSYQEVSELVEKQTEWLEYDHMIRNLAKAEDPLELASVLVDKLQHFAGRDGGTVLLARGLNEWHTVMNSAGSKYPPPIGLELQKGSIAAQALSDGEPFFSPHFNANPKRISPSEPLCYGTSLAVPVMHRQRRQLLAVVYSENPLLFNEVTKHKISNLCRITGLKLEAMLPGLDVYDNIFSTTTNSYSKELISVILSRLSGHDRIETPGLSTWVGMIAIGNINDMRTRYRLDDLTDLKRQILCKIRPQNFGIPGIIGTYSDYIYIFLLQSSDESACLSWSGHLKDAFREPMSFSSNKHEKVQLNIGVMRLSGEMAPDFVLEKIKKAMNDAVKQNKFIAEV